MATVQRLGGVVQRYRRDGIRCAILTVGADADAFARLREVVQRDHPGVELEPVAGPPAE